MATRIVPSGNNGVASLLSTLPQQNRFQVGQSQQVTKSTDALICNKMIKAASPISALKKKIHTLLSGKLEDS